MAAAAAAAAQSSHHDSAKGQWDFAQRAQRAAQLEEEAPLASTRTARRAQHQRHGSGSDREGLSHTHRRPAEVLLLLVPCLSGGIDMFAVLSADSHFSCCILGQCHRCARTHHVMAMEPYIAYKYINIKHILECHWAQEPITVHFGPKRVNNSASGTTFAWCYKGLYVVTSAEHLLY